jgi:hypothetical protein
MLKVMKSSEEEILYKREFASVRHGNFPQFISYIEEPIPEMVLWDEGEIKINPEPEENNFDFIGLFMAGPSMKEFYNNCVREYGVIIDNDISDEIYYKLSLFEISIRIHANNFKTLEINQTFQDIISNLGGYKNLEQNEIDILQKGRKLLNIVKHGEKRNYSWAQGIIDFEKAYQLTIDKKITII